MQICVNVQICRDPQRHIACYSSPSMWAAWLIAIWSLARSILLPPSCPFECLSLRVSSLQRLINDVSWIHTFSHKLAWIRLHSVTLNLTSYSQTSISSAHAGLEKVWKGQNNMTFGTPEAAVWSAPLLGVWINFTIALKCCPPFLTNSCPNTI